MMMMMKSSNIRLETITKFHQHKSRTNQNSLQQQQSYLNLPEASYSSLRNCNNNRKMNVREFSHFRSKCICCCCAQTSNCLRLDRHTEETSTSANYHDLNNDDEKSDHHRFISSSSSEYSCERSTIQCRKFRFYVRNYMYMLFNGTKSTSVSFFSLRRRRLR